jgi:hypothetical protein
MIQLFKLQNHWCTRAVQLLVQVFHLVFHLHLWWSAHGGGNRGPACTGHWALALSMLSSARSALRM